MTGKTSTGPWQGMDFLPAGICIIDAGYVVRYWNACLEEWTGITAEEVIGQRITERFPALDRTTVISRIDQTLRGGAPSVFSSQIHTFVIPSYLQDGSARAQRTSLIPLATDMEGLYHAMFICEDVSALTEQVKAFREMRNNTLYELEERKKAEMEMKDAYEDLLSFLLEYLSELSEGARNASDDLDAVVKSIEAGTAEDQDIRTCLLRVMDTSTSLERTLSDLAVAVAERKKEIPDVFKKSLIERGYTS
ncbi:PAS domain-containing protein [Methanofollis fontis]|uniref:PAS domain-containing protein n=1 Tax=Methanofollis fontis TaxID=2052832 RepID=A0A483CQV9_9EURY|nr:PAS domain-containing protein [Methanofollis fontis]TAJ45198.1 hypothetical protein CUJ86_00125 [Methanofollis fontis]